MMKPLATSHVLSLACFSMALCAADLAASPATISGSLKSLTLYSQEAPANLLPEYRVSSNRVRLESEWPIDRNWQLNTALDYQYLWSDPDELFVLSDRELNRGVDLDKVFDHGNAGQSRLQVDRFNLTYRKDALDVNLGRQAIGFGRILIFSPLDVIAPFAPDAIDTDIRIGIDALRATVNYGLDGQLGAIAVWGDKGRYNSYLWTWSDNRRGLDLLMIGGRLRGRNMLGAGIAGSIGTLGLKGELAIHRGRDLNKQGGDLDSTFTMGALESWYRFDNGLTLVAQYLYNGPGTENPHEYPKVASSAPLLEGLTYLLGQHYLIAAPSYDIHPLASIQGLIILNLTDDSGLFRPLLDLSLSDNISLQAFWTWNLGQKPEVISPAQLVIPQSEFGLRGDSGGLFFKWFF